MERLVRKKIQNRGRHPLPPEQRRSIILNLSCTELIFKRLERHAKRMHYEPRKLAYILFASGLDTLDMDEAIKEAVDKKTNKK